MLIVLTARLKQRRRVVARVAANLLHYPPLVVAWTAKELVPHNLKK